jgi:predicted aspartyl protease
MLAASPKLVRCCRLDRCSLLLRCLLVVAVIALPGTLAAQARQSKDIVSFQLRDKYLIVIQTTINGAGPFSFLLDTGATHTVIDPRLARQLQTSVIGEASLTTVSDVRKDKLVRLRRVRVGRSEVSELGAIIDKLDDVRLKAPGIRGVLGEDFLSNFDFLIDYKKHILIFDENVPAGERGRFETMGHYQGAPTTNRLLVEAEFIDVRSGKVELQLDTGAKMPELFPVPQDSFPSQPWAGSMAFDSWPNGTRIHPRITIKVGSTMVHDLDVVQSRRGVAFDAVGLLPASIFQRIYISHSGGFVVLNPGK